tara:strand:+ start:1191 stop:1781 length:591 start_codon:yes stop_codon:yes gene_type:complete
MTPKLWNMIIKIASNGIDDNDAGTDPMAAHSSADPEMPQQEMPNEGMGRPDPSQLDPETLQRLQQHAEEHKMIESLGLDHGSEYEEQVSQPAFNHPQVTDMEKESAKKKIYRYIKGQRRAWYTDDEMEKEAGKRASIIGRITRLVKNKNTVAYPTGKGKMGFTGSKMTASKEDASLAARLIAKKKTIRNTLTGRDK